MKTRQYRTIRRCRQQSGQGLIQAIFMMAGLLGLATLMTVFLVNMGMSVYYREKLKIVTANAAQYASTMKDAEGGKETVTTSVNELLHKLGMPNARSVEIKYEGKAAVVTVAVDNLPLFGAASALPSTLSLQDTESSRPYTNCAGYLALEFDDTANESGLMPPPSVPAFVPILADKQLEAADITPNRVFMFDTNGFPETKVIYHGRYPDGNGNGFWPNYR
jgi:hypothetical protein